MSTLFIIAAGKGTRMGGSLPKAFMDVGGKSNIQNTLEKASGRFKKAYIVANSSLRDVWTALVKQIEVDIDFEVLFIESGLGDGHAVLAALKHKQLKQTDFEEPFGSLINPFVTIVWGDVYIPDSGIFAELLSNNSQIVFGKIPVVKEENPYVTILTDTSLVVTGADFRKLGEGHATGFHDQSIFLFDTASLIISLENLHNALWKSGRYISPNGELSLLYVFHNIYNKYESGPIAFETFYPTMGFNTPEELEMIRKKYS
jgi:choline kinase